MHSNKYYPANIVFSQRETDTERVESYFKPVGFQNWQAARKGLQRLGNSPDSQRWLMEILPTLLLHLEDAASSDRALVTFERFADKHASKASFFHSLSKNPRATEMLILIFAGSQFLSEILIQNPLFFDKLKQPREMAVPKTRTQFAAELKKVIADAGGYSESLDAMRRYQKLEILRIGACDLFGLLGLEVIISQLSLLANALVHACLENAAQELDVSFEGFCVLALGKLGGRELNYSSDIDLIFLSQEKKPEYLKLGQRLIEALTKVTGEGFLYRVDMRLRPWGNSGVLVPTLEEYLNYFEKSARIWEKQAVLKGRKIAGDLRVGTAFFDIARPQIFQMPSEDVRAEIRKMKLEIETNLRKKGKKWGEVKGGKGSIRDVEFITQFLQLRFGGKHPEIWSRNTLDGLARLSLSGFISSEDYHVLANGYKFLRTAEHYLQIMHNQQVHALPEDERELLFLARRLGFDGHEQGKQFVDRYHEHSAAIRELYRKFLGLGKLEEQQDEPVLSTKDLTVEFEDHLKRLDEAYQETFTESEIKLHTELLENLSQENLVEVHAKAKDNGEWQIVIVGFDYLGELSLIAGLLFVHGYDIREGKIFTYEPEKGEPKKVATHPWNRRKGRMRFAENKDSRKKIIDVFQVTPLQKNETATDWQAYKNELNSLLLDLKNGAQAKAQGDLANKVAGALTEMTETAETMLPIEIAIDNTSTQDYTVIRIDAPDTFGFLYEFTNALALNGIYISRVHASSLERRAHDTLFVNGSDGGKITEESRVNQIRAAAVLVKHFTHLLPQSPNPASAMLNFREFLGQLFTLDDWPFELASLERPEVLQALARLLGVSEFLWEDFLRMQHGNLFPILTDVEALSNRIEKDALKHDLQQQYLTAFTFDEKKTVLNQFKDREMFRIDMRYIQMKIPDFSQFSEELSDLGEVVLESAFEICYDKLFRIHGLPLLTNGSACELSICALGKFGGREIGFASDIELMFLYSGYGQTNGMKTITNAEFFDKLVNEISHCIVTKRKGIFEIDLRLRPYGKGGSLAVQFGAFKNYFAPTGPAWNYERQALVKMRHIIGDAEFGEKIIAARDVCVFTGEKFDAQTMRGMRERQIRQLVAGGTLNAKFSSGALVDIEFLVQGLQITYGTEKPSLRIPTTLEALKELHSLGILSANDFCHLAEALSFLRRMIESLRMVRGNAKDLTVPQVDSQAFKFLSRRMGYDDDTEKFYQDILDHTSFVQEASKRLLD